MKLPFGRELINNGTGKYAVVDIKQRICDVWSDSWSGGCSNEAAYLAYRNITGASVQESWRAVKPWVKEWEGKKNG